MVGISKKHLQQEKKETEKETVVFKTLEAIRDVLKAKQGWSPSLSTIHRVLKRCKVSRRRFVSHSVNPRSSDDMKRMTIEFKNRIDLLSNDEIVCLDETAFCNIGNANYSYFPKGKQPIQSFVPKRQKYSVLMAIYSQGVVAHDIIPKAFDKLSFLQALKQIVPKFPYQTKAVLMDNVSFHRSYDVVNFLKENGIEPLYIPPYSPRCNPIEEVFSLLKRNFRNLELTERMEFKERIMTSIEKLNLNYLKICHLIIDIQDNM